MNPHKSLLIPLLLIILASGFGYRSYTKTEHLITADLNQAVKRIVLQERELTQHPDTVLAYKRLNLTMGTPVTVSSATPAFVQALTLEALRKRAVLSICLSEDSCPPVPAGCLASDTVLWMAPGADGAVLTFRGYARCTPWFILTQSDQTPSVLLLAVAPTVISNITLLLAVRHIGGTLTSILGAMEPVTAVVIGACVFGEAFTATEAVGIALILVAVVLVILTNRIKEGVDTVMKRIRPRHA